jgi:hypothetical protein
MDAMAPVPPDVPCAAASCVNARRAAAASAGQAIFDFIWFSFFEIMPSRQDGPRFKECYSNPGAFAYAKSARSEPNLPLVSEVRNDPNACDTSSGIVIFSISISACAPWCGKSPFVGIHSGICPFCA